VENEILEIVGVEDLSVGDMVGVGSIYGRNLTRNSWSKLYEVASITESGGVTLLFDHGIGEPIIWPDPNTHWLRLKQVFKVYDPEQQPFTDEDI